MDKPGDSGKNRLTISRGTFFKWASVALVVPFYKILDSAIESKTKTETKIVELPIESGLADGVHFFEKIILIKNKNKFRLMTSRCSHLGCRIDKEENGCLVCPCHGSRYDLQGKPVKGPANKPLEEVQFEMLKTNEKVVLRYKV